MDSLRHHLAILRRAYLEAVLAGKKTVECRLGRGGRPPYASISAGDLIWLKESGGPVRAVASVARIREYDHLTPARVAWLRTRFHRAVGAPASFWREAATARVATLIWLDWVCAVRPFRVVKADRRAWVVLASPPVPEQPLEAIDPPPHRLLDPRGGT